MLCSLLQNELLLASEAEKVSQRADLEDHIKTAQANVEEKKGEIAKLQKLLEQVLELFRYELHHEETCLLHMRKQRPLAIFYGCTAWLMSDLVGKFEDRFTWTVFISECEV